MIDLRRLQVLRAVQRCGTVTAAAGSLHLTPSAVSQQVRQLGKELGVALLEPQGRRVRLTPAARSLLAHADAIEERWREAEAELHEVGVDGPSGTLRMAGFPTAMCTLLSPTAARLRTTAPRLTVRMREADPVESFDLVFSGEADIAVVEATRDAPPLTDTRFDQRALLDDPFDLVVSVDHELGSEPEASLPELAAERWILGMPGSPCREHVLTACSRAGFTPDIAHQAQDWSVVGALVGDGHGIALVPRSVRLPGQEGIARIGLAETPPTRRFLTVTARGVREHPAVQAALTILEDLTEQGAPEL